MKGFTIQYRESGIDKLGGDRVSERVEATGYSEAVVVFLIGILKERGVQVYTLEQAEQDIKYGLENLSDLELLGKAVGVEVQAVIVNR